MYLNLIFFHHLLNFEYICRFKSLQCGLPQAVLQKNSWTLLRFMFLYPLFLLIKLPFVLCETLLVSWSQLAYLFLVLLDQTYLAVKYFVVVSLKWSYIAMKGMHPNSKIWSIYVIFVVFLPKQVWWYLFCFFWRHASGA